MAKTFELTNMLTSRPTVGVEVIGVGFMNNGEYAILNNCSLEYDSLTTEEKAIVDPFLDLMRIKVLACGVPDGGAS